MPLKLGNTAIDSEFRHYLQTSSGRYFHQDCVDNIKRIRAPFLLFSLLRVMNGLQHNPATALGSLTWARQIPNTAAWVCGDYSQTTTPRLLMKELIWDTFPKGESKICGDCFSAWFTNISDLWYKTSVAIKREIRKGYPARDAPQEYDSFQHAVDCLLKGDP